MLLLFVKTADICGASSRGCDRLFALFAFAFAFATGPDFVWCVAQRTISVAWQRCTTRKPPSPMTGCCYTHLQPWPGHAVPTTYLLEVPSLEATPGMFHQTSAAAWPPTPVSGTVFPGFQCLKDLLGIDGKSGAGSGREVDKELT
jgi:hypothetical protein